MDPKYILQSGQGILKQTSHNGDDALTRISWTVVTMMTDFSVIIVDLLGYRKALAWLSETSTKACGQARQDQKTLASRAGRILSYVGPQGCKLINCCRV